jgi:hypothetical protein
MNMAEAKQKLMEMADGKYHSIEYKLNDHGKGSFNQECNVYIDGYNHYKGAHWEDALAQLESAMSGKPAISEDLPLSKPKATASV